MSTSNPSPLSAFSQLKEDKLQRVLRHRPDVSTWLGFTQDNHRLPVSASLARTDALVELRRLVEAAPDLPPQKLSPMGKAQVAFQQQSFAHAVTHMSGCDALELHTRNPDLTGELTALLVAQCTDEQVPLQERMNAFSKRLQSVGTYLRGSQADIIDASPLLVHAAQISAHWGQAALQQIGAWVDASQENGATGAALSSELGRQVTTSLEQGQQAYADHQKWLGTLEVGPRFESVGREVYDQLLSLRGLDLNAESALALARIEMEEMTLEEGRLCRRAFKRVSRQEAYERSREQVPNNPQEAQAWLEELIGNSHQFCLKSGLFPMTDTDEVVVELAPQQQLQSQGALCCFFPARFAKAKVTRVQMARFAPGTDLHPVCVSSLEAQSASLFYPGEHLHALWAATSSDVLRYAVTPGLGDGPAALWGEETQLGFGHYAEELMRELQFRDSPASRFMMIRRSLQAAVHAFVDVSLALRQMDAETAVATLVRETALPQWQAKKWVLASVARPTHGLSRLLGKQHLHQLRRTAQVQWVHHYSDRRFHEMVLFAGRLPASFLDQRIDQPVAFTNDDGTAEYAFDEAPNLDEDIDSDEDTEVVSST